MGAESSATLAMEQPASGISSTVRWIPDLDPARRRALGEAVIALRLAQSNPFAGQMNPSAGALEETNEDVI